MTAWPVVTVEGLCSRVTSGGTPSRSKPEYYEPGEHLWVKSKELVDRSISDTEELISDTGLKGSSAKPIQPNTVLMAMYGANVGQLGWLQVPATVNQAICAMETDPEITDGRWLFYSLMHWRPALTAKAHGAAQQNLSQGLIREFGIQTPPLHVQRNIAAVLAAYDELIGNNLRRIEILEEVAQAVYREWFVNFRFPGHQDVALVDSPLGLIPEGWEVAALKDLCTRMQAGSTPARSKPGLWDEGGVDWYKTGELQDGFLLGSEEHVSFDAPIRTFEPGTILMAIYGSPTVGRMGIVVQPSSANQAALGLVPDTDQLGPILLFHLLLDRRTHFNSIAQGAAQQNISKAKVESTSVLLPAKSVAAAFEDLVHPNWSLRLNLALQNRNLRATRDLLLPKLVSGDIDVSDLDIDTEWLAS